MNAFNNFQHLLINVLKRHNKVLSPDEFNIEKLNSEELEKMNDISTNTSILMNHYNFDISSEVIEKYQKKADLLSFLIPCLLIHRQEVTKFSSNIQNITLMSKDEFLGEIDTLISSKISPSNVDLDYLKAILKYYPELEINNHIPFRDTKTLILFYRPDLSSKLINSINDILKLGVFINDLNSTTSLKRKERRLICEYIEIFIANREDEGYLVDAKSKYIEWAKLHLKLHPGDYKEKYPKCLDFFNSIINNKSRRSIKTWESQIQELYKTSLVDVIDETSKRSGVFLRKFDSLLRRCIKIDQDLGDNTATDYLLSSLKNLKNSNIKILIELLNYYKKRSNNLNRVIINRKSGKRTQLPKLDSLETKLTETVSNAIIERVKENIINKSKSDNLEEISEVYIDLNLCKFPIPNSLRESNSGLPIGTRLPLPNENIFRVFCRWIETSERREDIDLHAYLFKEVNGKLNYVSGMGWNSNSTTPHSSYSGDVRDREGICAEYMDFDISKCRNIADYVVVDLQNYKDRSLNTLDLSLGYCTRNSLSKYGDLNWKPEDENNLRMYPIKSKFNTSLVCIIDLVNRELISLDINTNKLPHGWNSSNECVFLDILNEIPSSDELNIFKVFELYYSKNNINIITDESLLSENTNIILRSKEIPVIMSILMEIIS